MNAKAAAHVEMLCELQRNLHVARGDREKLHARCAAANEDYWRACEQARIAQEELSAALRRPCPCGECPA